SAKICYPMREIGSGAAPAFFMEFVSLPYFEAFTRAYKAFQAEKLAEQVVWIGAGRLGLPQRAAAALCLGTDLIAVGREAMLSIGCVQARRCHDNRCPSGVATQDQRLQHGLEPRPQAERFARYCRSLRRSLLDLSRACGHEHPARLTPEDMELVQGPGTLKTLAEVYGYSRPGQSFPPNSTLSPADQ
ncbi:MAG: glutamate synthase-related protein, partial [Elusimicrobiota bacterium]